MGKRVPRLADVAPLRGAGAAVSRIREDAIAQVVEMYELRPRPSQLQLLARAIRGKRAHVSEQNHRDRVRGDEQLIPRVVELVQAGEVNKTIAAKLSTGLERIKRVRALAVQRGLLARFARR
jgi:hypothetical protein